MKSLSKKVIFEQRPEKNGVPYWGKHGSYNRE